jgi:TIR- and PNP-associating SLOG family
MTISARPAALRRRTGRHGRRRPITAAGPPSSWLFGRRVQISGSASAKADPALIAYAHQVVRNLVKGAMGAGGGIVVGLGKEPQPGNATADTPSMLFDWTALEAAAECITSGICTWPRKFGLPIVVATSEKAESEIPENRRGLYETLLKTGLLQVESILPGSRAAAFLRQRQAAFGDALVILGGGTGVEHSASLYLRRHKPVVPLDLPLGASRDDGTGGAHRLSKEARSDPARFFHFEPAFAHREGAALASIATHGGAAAPTDISANIIELLTKLAPPTTFYVRLLNPNHTKFSAVESFFREVVDPVVQEAGLARVEIGTDKSEHAFMNVAIFASLHFSSMAIVDVTGERPNCFIELGYALGTQNRVLVTAEEGTKLPFDQEMIPCHFWKPTGSVADRKKALIEFWEKNINRPPIVKLE